MMGCKGFLPLIFNKMFWGLILSLQGLPQFFRTRSHSILNPPLPIQTFPPAPWCKVPRERRQRSAVKSTNAAKMKRRGCPIGNTPAGGGMVILSRLLFGGKRHVVSLKTMYTSSCFGWIWKFDSFFHLSLIFGACYCFCMHFGLFEPFYFVYCILMHIVYCIDIWYATASPRVWTPFQRWSFSGVRCNIIERLSLSCFRSCWSSIIRRRKKLGGNDQKPDYSDSGGCYNEPEKSGLLANHDFIKWHW